MPNTHSRKVSAPTQRVLVLADGEKREVQVLLAQLVPWLAARTAHVQVCEEVRTLDTERAHEFIEPRPELVVVLGGDGALLGAVRAFSSDPVPVLGINFGRVGFLTSAEAAHWESVLAGIFEGEGVLEPRMRLSARLERPQGAGVQAIALNDVVLTRGAFQGMLELRLAVDGSWVTDYRADGLIVATPSGSTAYSLAAGGPILAPQMDGIVVTPICPHSLSHRPIVLEPDAGLELTITRASGITTMAVDGQGFFSLSEGDRVRLERNPRPYPLLVQPGLDPYRRLRDRLGWKGSFEAESAAHEAQRWERGPGSLL